MDKSSRRIYKNIGGIKVPGVTTILGVLNKPALLEWAWKLGKEGIDYKTVRDTAASIGTICHFMCECYLKGQEADLSEFPKDQVSLAENGFIKFLDYWEKSGFTVIETEIPLIHETLSFGGTLDIVCKDKEGRFVLLDLKTSKALYPEYWSQVSAYKKLWNLNNDDKIERNIIIRIGKEEIADLEIVEKNDLTIYWDLFEGALMVYKAQQEIKK